MLSANSSVTTGAVNQIVVNSPALVQQLVTGKAQLATINGQQVILRNASGGNLVPLSSGNIVMRNATMTPTKTIIAQQITGPTITTATTTTMTNKAVNNNESVTPDSSTKTSAAELSPDSTTPQATQTQATSTTPAPGSVEESLLVGQPPGTVIKCVTAQVIQTSQGPRIVLHGLQGSDFTSSQLAMVQQQVKQQLLKAQTTSGNKGVLGPTKIYLAVQPGAGNTPQQNSSATIKNEPSTPSKKIKQEPVATEGRFHCFLSFENVNFIYNLKIFL